MPLRFSLLPRCQLETGRRSTWPCPARRAAFVVGPNSVPLSCVTLTRAPAGSGENMSSCPDARPAVFMLAPRLADDAVVGRTRSTISASGGRSEMGTRLHREARRPPAVPAARSCPRGRHRAQAACWSRPSADGLGHTRMSASSGYRTRSLPLMSSGDQPRPLYYLRMQPVGLS